MIDLHSSKENLWEIFLKNCFPKHYAVNWCLISQPNRFLTILWKSYTVFLLYRTAIAAFQYLYQIGFLFPFPVDTVRKLSVHKTFRRRPGRLLNVLSTFNLCPVSMELDYSLFSMIIISDSSWNTPLLKVIRCVLFHSKNR